MIYTREDLFEMREEMAEYRDRIRSKLKAAPEGRIMITERNGRSNYFRNLYDEKGERIRREGITRKRNMIADLAIKDYNAELLSLLDEDIRLLDRLLFWEICGMMDNRGYREAQIRKRAIYESNGFAEWKGNLIFTYARGNEYNSEQIESVVRNQILLKI